MPIALAKPVAHNGKDVGQNSHKGGSVMSYSVMFYAVDVPKLQAIYGSKNEALLKEVIDARSADLDDNDAFFEDYGLPVDSRSAIRQIFEGTVPQDDLSVAAMYGYVLKILCEHLGEFAGGDIYSTRILPFDSKLMANGPPIPIPDDPGDFPEIGYLTKEGILAEKEAAANALPPSSPNFYDNMREFTHHALDEDELLEELEAYQDVLAELAETGLGTVAFRH